MGWDQSLLETFIYVIGSQRVNTQLVTEAEAVKMCNIEEDILKHCLYIGKIFYNISII